MTVTQKTNFERIAEFHEAFGVPRDMSDRLVLRRKLMSEEFEESMTALADMQQNPADKTAQAELLKELVDLLYVTYGTIYSLGWDADAAFAEVHASNMSKVGDDGKPQYREDGKILKSPNYRKPDMEKFVHAG